MPRRPVLAALLASIALAGGATACSPSRGPTGPAAATPPRIGLVEVDPSAGPIGTMFTLTAKGLTEGLVVAFEITFPGEGRAYPGAAWTVPADGTATTTYRATTANVPGDYTVRLTGPPGILAEGRFKVTDGPALTTTTYGDTSGSSTTGRTGTTTRSGRSTTTVAGSGLSSTSTIKVPNTTATTRRSPTTTARSTTTSKP